MKRTANEGQGSNWIRKAKRLRIYARDGWRCVWCGCVVSHGREFHLAPYTVRLATLDHVVPRPRGSNAAGNLITACYSCNSARGGMTALEFAVHRTGVSGTCADDIDDFWREVAATLERVLDAMGKELP